jgi:hypothetical protein
MEILGTLRHKGSQYGEGEDKDNFFGVRASLDTWPDKWHNEQHPRGWFQWYKGYSEGKRTDDDERQIKRWISFKARHLAQLQKADPTLENLSIQPKRRQALLNWAIAPGINVEEEVEKKNKYLEKIAMDPISMMAMHALSTHVVQNLAMKHALKSKALAQHVANGFSEGLKGVVNNSTSAKVKRFASGALMPEINAMHGASWEAGHKLAPYIDKMTTKQKAGLHMLVTGNHHKAIARKLHESPLVQNAYNVVKETHGLKPLHELIQDTHKTFSKTDNPLINNLAANIHKGHKPVGANFVPGRPSAKAAISGGLVTSVLDPVSGGLNTMKNITQSSTIRNHPLGKKIIDKLENKFVKEPFYHSLEHGYKKNVVKDTLTNVFLSPINTHLKQLGGKIKEVKDLSVKSQTIT